MSREHFIIFDPATGQEVSRGVVPAGHVDRQAPDGRSALALPVHAMRGDLAAHAETVRATVQAKLDRKYVTARGGTPAARLRHALDIEDRINRAQGVADMLMIDVTADWPRQEPGDAG